MVKVKIGDKLLEVAGAKNLAELATQVVKQVKSTILAARLNGSLVDLTASLPPHTPVEFITEHMPEGLEIVRHSSSHIMADAVKQLFPKAKLAIGPPIEDGFYYDFDVEEPFTAEDLKKIEKKMAEIIRKKVAFQRQELPHGEVLKLMNQQGESYKVELLEGIKDATVSLYRHGDFIDLCRGPHLAHTGLVKAYKLLSATGAYWRGDEKNKMLQRIYGTAFVSPDELKAYLQRQEEAKKRDHRRLGKELDLFSIHYEQAGSGLVYWHPKGAMVRKITEDFWCEEHLKNGYELIYSPHIAKIGLWKTSGHLDFYGENMFSPIDIDGQQYILKPMNCPGHILVYKTKVRSYRDLPLRWAELGTVYRYERSGVIQGLLRVRGFTQDDAHIFCRPDQLNDEIKDVIKMGLAILSAFGFSDFKIRISTQPDKYVGTREHWDTATQALKAAVEAVGLPYEVAEGEAVFYGPKADIDIKDCLGRAWQCFTVQVDFNIPERFDIVYTASDGQQVRPIMIHRALLGSLERFLGVLIEHYGGAFPLWLAPVQVMVLPVLEPQHAYARTVKDKLCAAGMRAEVDTRNERLTQRIKEATKQKIPYMVVVGDQEIVQQTVAIRDRLKGNLGASNIEDFIKRLVRQVKSKE